jgi:hypothetical protein
MGVDPNFYRTAWQGAQDAFGFGQEAYAEQGVNLKRAQKEMQYWQTNLGTEEQQHSAFSSTFEVGKTPGKRFFADLGLDKTEFKTKEQREALFSDMFGASIEEANALMADSLAASRAGDTDEAKRLKAEADELMAASGAPMMDQKGRVGKERWRGSGIRQTGGISDALEAPDAMIIGANLRRAEALMDPESEERAKMRESLTGAARADLDAAEVTAGRALATGERQAIAGLRTQKLATGAMVSPLAQAAAASRVTEQFAGSRANVATMLGAERAKVEFQADMFMEQYIPEFANNAVAASAAFVKDRAFINDTYLTLQTSLAQTAMQMSGQFAGVQAQVASAAYGEQVRAEYAADELAASEETDWVSLGVGVVATIATAWAGGVGGAMAMGALTAAKGASEVDH